MKYIDMLKMSSSNLWKRKVRTVLTVLGVVIGVASIVVMVSLGLGLKESVMGDIENYGSLTTVTVTAPYNYDTSSEDALSHQLSDDTVAEFEKLEHVKSASPTLQVNTLAKSGRYMSYLNVYGMTKTALEKMNMPIAEGSLPDGTDGELEFFYGNHVLEDFYLEKKGTYPYYEDGTLPDIDLMNDSLFIIFDTDAYYSAGTTGDGGTVQSAPKKYIIPTSGVAGGDSYGNYSWSVYCDLDELIAKLKKVFKTKAIPGQPTTKTGKPYKTIYYSSILVEVDDMDNVTTVQQTISDMGYDASSDAEWIQQEQQTMGYIQAVLGGIGAVSLLVAAIGIANTMMMSIYERTKEIGIMKVLGCDMRNIRTMFLMEAGYIGLIGGIVGVALSFLISFIINHVLMLGDALGTGGSISVIPVWLVGVSILFAIVIGMLAGFFPANRAMKLSPLAAIKNE